MSSKSLESKEEFDEELEELLFDGSTADSFSAKRRIAATRKSIKAFIFAQTVVIIILIVLSAVLLSKRYTDHSNIEEDEIFSPAQHVVRPKLVNFQRGFSLEGTKYQGPPTDERNAAWDELYNSAMVKIPRSSAKKMINRTLPVPGQPGYYAVGIEVFHQLHCLNYLRRYIWASSLPESAGQGLERKTLQHMDHCIDTIRQSLMCSADITPLPWRWNEERQKAVPVIEVAHKCRDFDAIHEWAMQNKVIEFDPLLHAEDKDWDNE
ncbi:hypothetical protein ABW20_dc0103818 [Dactylellina cionopaga]|nr:hypothetical protein ABW20_dc0103818 [Dactylellina cionopaga]